MARLSPGGGARREHRLRFGNEVLSLKKFKVLATSFEAAQLLSLTPEQYRQKWTLPSDYPMIAPSYAAQRSALAKKTGLGQMRRGAG